MKIVKAMLVSGMYLALLTSCSPLSFQVNTPTPIPDISRRPQKIEEIELLWSIEDAHILWNRFDATLDASAGKVCFLGNLGEKQNYYNIVCIDSQNGEPLWKIKSEVHRAIETTPDGVYVTYGSGAEIRKYGSQTGDLIWRKSLSATGSHYLYFFGEQLQVLTTSEDLWILNTNGERIEKLSGERFFLKTPDETFINLKGIQALETNTKSVLWEHADLHLILAPIITDDKILLRSEDSLGNAYALDRKTGTQLWNVPNVLSNIVYSPKKQLIYALRENGDLLAIDENSGTENVIATFFPPQFLFFGEDVLGYQLAYDREEQILIIALGDSAQIFAFQE